jgi:hypothetical protein
VLLVALLLNCALLLAVTPMRGNMAELFRCIYQPACFCNCCLYDGNFVLYKASLLDLPVSSAHRLAHVVRRLPKLSGNPRTLSGVSVDGTASHYTDP